MPASVTYQLILSLLQALDAQALLELAARFAELPKSDAGPVDGRAGLHWASACLPFEDLSARSLGWTCESSAAFESPSDEAAPPGQPGPGAGAMKLLDGAPQCSLLCAHKRCVADLKAMCTAKMQRLLARWHADLDREAQWQSTWASMSSSLRGEAPV
jgi:hypothetical protein